jgi:hypothetical protein
MVDPDRIQTDWKTVMPFDEVVHELCDRGEYEEVEDMLRDRLYDELRDSGVDCYMDDYDTAVVETSSFVGSHRVKVDSCDSGVHVSEEGKYVHVETDCEVVGVVGPIDELQEVAHEHHHGDHPGEAALTVGERNPGLGGGNLL